MLDTLVILFITYMVARLLVNWVMSTSEYEDVKRELLEEADRRIREVKLEVLQEHNTVLAYDKENNDFLGQAVTIDAVKEVLKQRWPTKIFLLDGTNEVITALPMKELK